MHRRALDHVGVLAIRILTIRGLTLLAKEMAPRVHNSGHWTIEGAVTSQFENHLRAVLGLPLVATMPRGHSVMLNLIGTIPDRAAVLAVGDAHVHLYAKLKSAPDANSDTLPSGVTTRMLSGCGLAICRHCCRARLISSIKPFVMSLSKHRQMESHSFAPGSNSSH